MKASKAKQKAKTEAKKPADTLKDTKPEEPKSKDTKSEDSKPKDTKLEDFPPEDTEPQDTLQEDAMPKAEAKKKGRSIKGHEGNWTKYRYLHYGTLCHNTADGSISAHCERHGGRCRAPKTLKKKSIGYAALFLERGQDIPAGPEFCKMHMDIRLLMYQAWGVRNTPLCWA